MQRTKLRIVATEWDTIRRLVAPSFRGGKELGTLGIVGVRNGKERPEYLVREILLPRQGEVVSDRGSLRFTPGYVRRAHLRARSLGAAGILAVHSHPHADTTVQFSGYDDQEEPEFAQNLRDIQAGTLLCSIVLGARSQAGRVWDAHGRLIPLGEMMLVGETICFEPLDGSGLRPTGNPAAAFDAGFAVTGTGALGALANMTIAVVGASGTGSLTCELLARAGCGKVLLFDFDSAEARNLNRILHSATRHVSRKAAKVDFIADEINGTGLPTLVIPVNGNIVDRAVLSRLDECDLIIGCVDKTHPRLVLSKYAYRHLVPYIDMGTEIGATSDASCIASVDARMTYSCPGRACLRCLGYIDPRRLAYETTVRQERQRIRDLGYSDDLELSQPAVMDVNMIAAGQSMIVLRHLLQPFLETPLPSSIKHNLICGTTRKLVAMQPKPDCTICGSGAPVGSGMEGEEIGLTSEQVAAL